MDGKEFIKFTVGNPAGFTAGGNEKSWKPVSLRRKSPSQQKRDDKRKEEFVRKKNLDAAQEESNEFKVEAVDPQKAAFEVPVDEINLEKLDEQCSKVFNIKGEFKDPNRKPWLEKIPNAKENEHIAFWDLIEKHKDNIGLEDFSDGSTYVEHYLEFWGDLQFKPGTSEKDATNLDNWPKGVRNLVKR